MATALLVLDMLQDFVEGALANPAAHRVTDPIAQLADRARATEGWTVIYANDAHQPGDLEFAVFGEHALAGSSGAAVIDPLTPHDGDVVVPLLPHGHRRRAAARVGLPAHLLPR